MKYKKVGMLRDTLQIKNTRRRCRILPAETKHIWKKFISYDIEEPSLSLWIRSVHILNYHYHLFISNWSGMHLSSSCYQLSASGFNLNVFIILSHRLVFGWEAWSVFPMPSLHCSAPEFGFCSLLFPRLLGPECRTVEQDLLPVTLVQ